MMHLMPTFTALGALGMGFNPAIHAVALALYNARGGRDSGKLFGAMSVVQVMRCVRLNSASARQDSR